MTTTTTLTTLTAPSGPRPAHLGPLLAFVWLCSLAGGAVGIGVFFVAERAYRLSTAELYALGVLMGMMYIVGALAVGPALRRLTARYASISSRGALAGVMLIMAAPCLAAFLAREQFALWVFAVVYQIASGALWPIAEAYISGGRRGRALRSAIGAFNYVWASAIAVSYWAIAPLLDVAPLAVFAGAAGIHMLCALLLVAFPPEPGRHLEENHEPHPPVYLRLLRCFRWLLVVSYFLMYALTPMLPMRLKELGVPTLWSTPLVSAWMVSRIAMFVLLERWHGWHGRWRTPIWTAGAMLGGFAISLLAPSPAVLAVGLALFGVGLGGVYCAALYYAMAVGAAAVEAGGRHEATIGAGITLGPALGLGAWALVGAGALPEDGADLGLLLLAGLAAIGGVLAAAWSARPGRAAAEPPPTAPGPHGG